MFRRLPDDQRAIVRLSFDGRAIEAREGDSVAAALLANGIVQFRTTPAGNNPRGPFCLMGTCFDCLVNIDGAANRQACMIPVSAGMAVQTQHGKKSIT
ncbi:MAG: (2Fe-2S)-binding protein [Rhodospirillales bacterium]